MNRIYIRLDNEILQALAILAEQEYRDIRSQAALMVREGLILRGLINQNPFIDKTHEEITDDD